MFFQQDSFCLKNVLIVYNHKNKYYALKTLFSLKRKMYFKIIIKFIIPSFVHFLHIMCTHSELLQSSSQHPVLILVEYRR